jgi:YegS/Rv2252/BmrU family lipid kinase
VKVLSIINPVSGSKKAVDIYHQLKMEEKGLTSAPYITTHPGHAQEILQNVDLKEYAAVIIFGGDGTIHEVVNGIMSRTDGIRRPLGIIPLGTGNALMHDLNILTIEKSIHTILKKNITRMDLFRCQSPDQTLYSFNIVGWGIAVTINHVAEKLRFIGNQRYNLASLFEIMRNPKWNCKVTIDNQVLEGRMTFFMACNTMYTGNGMKIAPKANLSSGKIDVIVFMSHPWYKLIPLFLQVFSGKHVANPKITYLQAEHVILKPTEKMPLNIDGQQIGHAPVVIDILPQEIEIFT